MTALDPAFSRRVGAIMSTRVIAELEVVGRVEFVEAVTAARSFEKLSQHYQKLITRAEAERKGAG